LSFVAPDSSEFNRSAAVCHGPIRSRFAVDPFTLRPHNGDRGVAMGLRERIGIDFGGKMRIEDALVWAAANEVFYADVCVDHAPNAIETFDAARISEVRLLQERHGIRLGLHTLSAVNVAETSPFLRDAVDQYLRAYVDLAQRLDAGWIVVHAGYHFTSDYESRKQAALDRLQRVAEYAGTQGVRLLLENMNREPDDAEVRYLCYDVSECRYYLDGIRSAHLGWAYTVNHAHMLPEGISGFTRAFDLARCGEVRVADNRGDKEEHLRPGEGTIDFEAMFDTIEGAGYRGHYMLAFGSIEDMRQGREYLVALAEGREPAGVAP
jgi:sugar phosphate isomerase/epimerase